MRSSAQLRSSNLTHDNIYGHGTCEGGDMPLGAPTHKLIWSFNHVAVWDDVTNWIHYISNSRRHKHETKQGGGFLWKYPTLKVKWPGAAHLINWWNYISTFTRIMAHKLDRVLTSGGRFRTQTPKLSSTSCYRIKTKIPNSKDCMMNFKSR